MSEKMATKGWWEEGDADERGKQRSLGRVGKEGRINIPLSNAIHDREILRHCHLPA